MSTKPAFATCDLSAVNFTSPVGNDGAEVGATQLADNVLSQKDRLDEMLPRLPCDDTFWPYHPPRRGVWWEPPVAPPAKVEIEKLAKWLEEKGHPAQARRLWLAYHRAEHAREELESLVAISTQRLEDHNRRVQQQNRQLDERIAEAQKRLQQAWQELEEAQQQAAKSFAAAGLPCDPTAPNLEEMRRALIPPPEVVVGEDGFSHRPPSPVGFALLFDLVAPLVIGFMVALCLGTLTGLVELSDLNRLAYTWPKFLLVGLLGGTMVYLFGTMASHIAHSIAFALLDRQKGQPPQQVKRWIAPLVLLLSALALLLVLAAEIAVEGIGIRELHAQFAATWARLSGQAVEPTSLRALPMWLALLIGTVITAPYIFSKVARAWEACEASQRENWIRHRQHQHVEERLKDEKVAASMEAAEKIWLRSR